MVIPAWIGVVWGYVLRGGSAMWASIASLIGSPSVWLACTAVFVGGFATGHWERGRVLKTVKGELTQAVDEAAALQNSVTQLEAKLMQALKEGQAAVKALNDARAELGTKTVADAKTKAKSAKKEPLK